MIRHGRSGLTLARNFVFRKGVSPPTLPPQTEAHISLHSGGTRTTHTRRAGVPLSSPLLSSRVRRASKTLPGPSKALIGGLRRLLSGPSRALVEGLTRTPPFEGAKPGLSCACCRRDYCPKISCPPILRRQIFVDSAATKEIFNLTYRRIRKSRNVCFLSILAVAQLISVSRILSLFAKKIFFFRWNRRCSAWCPLRFES